MLKNVPSQFTYHFWPKIFYISLWAKKKITYHLKSGKGGRYIDAQNLSEGSRIMPGMKRAGEGTDVLDRGKRPRTDGFSFSTSGQPVGQRRGSQGQTNIIARGGGEDFGAEKQ